MMASIHDHDMGSNLLCEEDAASAVDLWEDDDDDVKTTDDQHVDGGDGILGTVEVPECDDAVSWILDKEHERMPDLGYVERVQNGLMDVSSSTRQDAIVSILKVQSGCNFGPVTSYLAINYLDRFLSARTLQGKGGWPIHLLSIACISVAAKMEETDVPTLLDLQLLGNVKYIFEPQAIQRMEVLVMATLNWRMRSITPFRFLNYFIEHLEVSNLLDKKKLCHNTIQLILNTTRVIDFLRFQPSCITAAALMCSAADEGLYFKKYPSVFLSREGLWSCLNLMKDLLLADIGTNNGWLRCKLNGQQDDNHHHRPPTPPQSPIGVN